MFTAHLVSIDASAKRNYPVCQQISVGFLKRQLVLISVNEQPKMQKSCCGWCSKQKSRFGM